MIIPNSRQRTTVLPEIIEQTLQKLFARTTGLLAELSGVVPDRGRLSITDLRLLEDLLADPGSREVLLSLLSPEEGALFSRFTYAKRRREWLGGRLAAKRSLERLHQGGGIASATWPALTLLPDAHGRPRLADPPEPLAEATVSISHSHDYATALALPTGPCGLDLQLASQRLYAVQERMTDGEELELFSRETDQLVRLAVIWTAKEAVKKGFLADQATFFGTIGLTGVSEVQPGRLWIVRCGLSGHGDLEVRAGRFGEYFLACTTGAVHA